MGQQQETKLKKYRIKHGITKAKLAKEADCDPKTIYGIEEDKQRSRDTTRSGIVNALAKLSGEPYKVEDFFDEEGNPLFE